VYGLRYANQLPTVVRQEFEGLVAAIKRWGLTEHNEDGSHRTAERLLNVMPVGAMVDFAGATAPAGFRLCDGSQVSRITYRSLFDVIGTTYGIGDGSLTFNLPDYRGRFPLTKTAAGTGSTLGASGGALDHVHTVGSHTHSVSITSASNGGFSTNTGNAGGHGHSFGGGSTDQASGSFVNVAAGGDHTLPTFAHTHDAGSLSINGVSDHNHSVSVSDHTHGVSGSTGSASGGDTGGSNPPYLVANRIIFTGVSLN
jgi:microcystin-dependent protein